MISLTTLLVQELFNDAVRGNFMVLLNGNGHETGFFYGKVKDCSGKIHKIAINSLFIISILLLVGNC